MHPANEAKGGTWVVLDGVASIVFIFDRGRKMAESLSAWCNNQPEDWFKLHRIIRPDGRYCVVLAPDLGQIAEGVHVTLGADDVDIVTAPVYSVPLDPSATLARVSPYFKESAYVGFADSATFMGNRLLRPGEKPQVNLQADVAWIGSIKWGTDPEVEAFAMNLIARAEEQWKELVAAHGKMH
jgi:hypothetical protein